MDTLASESIDQIIGVKVNLFPSRFIHNFAGANHFKPKLQTTNDELL